ncbi:heavy-metal-associated domain-containing protein, partial [Thiolapillus sp.]
SLEAVPGVSKVEVSLEPGSATIEGDVDTAALLAAVKDAGYEAMIHG